jgi:hypothetical protein
MFLFPSRFYSQNCALIVMKRRATALIDRRSSNFAIIKHFSCSEIFVNGIFELRMCHKMTLIKAITKLHMQIIGVRDFFQYNST